MKTQMDSSNIASTADAYPPRDTTWRTGALHASLFTSVSPTEPGSSGTDLSLPTSHNARHLEVGKSADEFWFAAECLAGRALEPTVIANAAGPHRFQRVFREANLAHKAPEFALQAFDLVQRAVRERQAVTANLRARGRNLPANCRPLFGPSDAIHALRMEVGTLDSSGLVPLIPLEFDADNLAHFGRPDGPAPALFDSNTTWTVPALLERVVWLDRRLDLIALFDPSPPPTGGRAW